MTYAWGLASKTKYPKIEYMYDIVGFPRSTNHRLSRSRILDAHDEPGQAAVVGGRIVCAIAAREEPNKPGWMANPKGQLTRSLEVVYCLGAPISIIHMRLKPFAVALLFGLTALFSLPAFGQVIYEQDCNDPDAHDLNCTEPSKAIIWDAQANGYKYYVGHAEPTTLFYSGAGASGNNMQWKFTLPTTDPNPNQSGTNVANFELYSTFWIGLALCDPNSNPFGPCTSLSDANNPATAGSAFLELQFYPPGINCSSSSQWCVNLHINTLENNNAFQKTNCLEPTTAVYVTTNGTPGGTQLAMNNGDTIVVTIQDTANGLKAIVTDLTTSTSGTMVASGANGFVHNANTTDCSTAPFDFHAEFATAAQGQGLPWASLPRPNVAFDFEIGHWELCSDSACSSPPMEPNGPGNSNVADTNCGTVRGVGGCFDSENDHDGTSYLADWPDGTGAHPASLILMSPDNQGVGPLSANTSSSSTYDQGYKTIRFATTEATTGAFYPFYSQAGTGASCVFNFGNDIPGTTTNDFGKATQFGAAAFSNPCFPAALTSPSLNKSFLPASIPLNTTTTVSFTVTNPNGTAALTGVGFSDNLPLGLTVAGAVIGNCGGGTISAASGLSFISLTGATIPAGGSCTFSVPVFGGTAGVASNVTSTVVSDESFDGSTATAIITVVSPPVISKAFTPDKFVPLGSTTVSFSIANPNGFAGLTGVAFTDILPAGLTVAAPNGLISNCGGTTSANAGSATITLSGGSIAPSGSCTVSAAVTAPEGIYNNSVQVTSTNGGPGNTTLATVIVATPPNLIKGFGEVSITPDSSTTLTLTLANPNRTVMLDALAFSDTLPSGLVVSTPNGLTGSCDGGTIGAPAGSNLISLASASLAPGTSCTFTVNVKSNGTVVGDLTNTTTTVTSTEALPGAAASANLFIGQPFQVNYSANLNFGESYIDIGNAGTNGAPVLGPGFGGAAGNICVNVYAFDPSEELISCCSCLVTPGQTVSLGVNADLTSKTLTDVVPISVTVKLLTTLAGGTGTGTTCNSSAATAAGTLANGTTAFRTTLHETPVSGSLATTETQFTPATLSAGELASITGRCASIIGNASGFGICNSCRTGALGGGKL